MITPDGVPIAVYDWGGQGPDLLMAHATGFHGRVFAALARHLAGHFHCWSLDHRGHGDSGPSPDDDYGWGGFRRDVLAVIDALELDRPFGLGHSCGGAALLLAEEERPGTFSGLYCYEPIVPPPPDPATSAAYNPMAVAARRRRSTFEDRQTAFDNYSAKAPLAAIDPEVLWDYVEYGLIDTPDGTVTLKCRREVEAAVYENAYSHGAYDRLGLIHIPVTVASGGDTEATTGYMALAAAAKLGQGPGEILAGLGHFGPLQDPTRVAASVLSALVPATPG